MAGETTVLEPVAQIGDLIDWKTKLSSRKFWFGCAGIIIAIVVAFFGDNLTAEQSDLIKNAIWLIVSYVVGESAVDISKFFSNLRKGTVVNNFQQAVKEEK